MNIPSCEHRFWQSLLYYNLYYYYHYFYFYCFFSSYIIIQHDNYTYNYTITKYSRNCVCECVLIVYLMLLILLLLLLLVLLLPPVQIFTRHTILLLIYYFSNVCYSIEFVFLSHIFYIYPIHMSWRQNCCVTCVREHPTCLELTVVVPPILRIVIF